METEENFAVEIKTAQAKKLGASSNLYIVEGEDFCFFTSSKESLGSIRCEITTRSGSSKNRIGYLEKSDIPVDGCDPRPNHQHEWVEQGNRWVRVFS